MKPTARSRRIFVLLLAVIGTAALFLPFAWSESLWDAVSRYSWFGEMFLLGAPFLLSIPTLAWQARRLAVDRLSSVEVAAAYLLSAAAMLSTIGVVALPLMGSGKLQEGEVIWITVTVAAAVPNVLQLVRNSRAGVSRANAAEAFLLGGYIPNAILCLAGFDRLQLGAYLIAVVSIGYVAAIVLLSQGEHGNAPGPAGVATA